MKTILKVEALNKSFHSNQILRDIHFTVGKGEFVAIMGRSGSGKSTLLYNVSGMDQATAGSVYYDQQEITSLKDDDMSAFRLKKMGFIFQHSYLLKNLTIKDNVILPGFKAGVLKKEAVVERAEYLLEKTGISEIANHPINEVSGGQLQRAGICRALINQPDILFGDEPTGALNSSATYEIMDLIGAFNKEGTTVILVTHDAKVALRASRIIYLLDGQIHDELKLGEYEAATAEVREITLNKWLLEQGF